MQLVFDECHRTSLMINQHWFGKWLSAIRQQAITWANVNPDLWCQLATMSQAIYIFSQENIEAEILTRHWPFGTRSPENIHCKIRESISFCLVLIGLLTISLSFSEFRNDLQMIPILMNNSKIITTEDSVQVYKKNISVLFMNHHLEHFLWNWSYFSVTQPHWWQVNTGSSNGSVPSDNKPLHKPKSTQIYVVIWHH